MIELLNPQRKIFAILEEAGEESVTSLLNTCRTCRGSSQEVQWLSTVLRDLMDKGFIEITDRRDPSSRTWIPLPVSASRSLLSELAALMKWSVADQAWKWAAEGTPLVYVLLTDKGLDAARRFLRQYGWPEADGGHADR
jgi:hypothetical protein